MSVDADTQCARATDDPDFVCPNNRPVLCERIVCCMESGCGGACVEDQYAEGQCVGKMDYGHICTGKVASSILVHGSKAKLLAALFANPFPVSHHLTLPDSATY